MPNSNLGLFESSFNVSTDLSFFFPSPVHRQAVSTIVSALQDGEGFLILNGPAGTGKTITLKQVVRSLDLFTRPVFVEERDQLKNIPNFICEDLELDRQRKIKVSDNAVELGYFLDNIKTVKTDELLAFVNRNLAFQTVTQSGQLAVISEYLAAERQENRNVVLFIDNGDDLKLSSLDSLIELTFNAKQHERLLQIVIAGSPFLAQRLKKRYGNTVALHCELSNLTNSYIGPFIKKMMKVNGFKTKDTFSSPAVSKIARISKGNPGRINAICRASLLNANLTGHSRITAEIVEANASGVRRLYSDQGSDKVSEIDSADGPVPTKASKTTNKAGEKQPSAEKLGPTKNGLDLPFDPLERFKRVTSKSHTGSIAKENTSVSEGEVLPASNALKIRISRGRPKTNEVIETRKTLTEKFVPRHRALAFVRSQSGYFPAIFASTLVLGLIFYSNRNPVEQGMEFSRKQSSNQASKQYTLAARRDKQNPEPSEKMPLAKDVKPGGKPGAPNRARYPGVIDSDNEKPITVQNEMVSADPGAISSKMTKIDRKILLNRDVLDGNDLAWVNGRGLAVRNVQVNDGGFHERLYLPVKSIRETQWPADRQQRSASQERLNQFTDNRAITLEKNPTIAKNTSKPIITTFKIPTTKAAANYLPKTNNSNRQPTPLRVILDDKDLALVSRRGRGLEFKRHRPGDARLDGVFKKNRLPASIHTGNKKRS